MFARLFFAGIVIAIINPSIQFQDEFHEELFLKPLPTGHINSFFQFSTEWTLNRRDSRNVLFTQIFVASLTHDFRQQFSTQIWCHGRLLKYFTITTSRNFISALATDCGDTRIGAIPSYLVLPALKFGRGLMEL